MLSFHELKKSAENRFFLFILVSSCPIVTIEIEHQTEIIINGVFLLLLLLFRRCGEKSLSTE